MKKRLLFTTLALSLALSGCIFEVQGPDEPTTTPIQPETVVQEPDENTPEISDTQKEDSDVDVEPDESIDVEVGSSSEPDTSNADESDWDFVKGEGDLPENILAKESYEDIFAWYYYNVDMDKDGNDEQFVIVELNDPEYADLAGELWFIGGDGKAQIIGNEGYLEYYSQVSSYDYGTQIHVAIGYTYGIGGDGYLFSYSNGTLKEHSADFVVPGYKSFNEAGEVEAIRETYEAYLDVDPDFGPMWSGHTWVPYYYKFNGNNYAQIKAESAGLDKVQEMADFDESTIDSEEEVYGLYIIGDDKLMVNTKKTGEGDMESYSYYVYVYEIDSDTETWELYERTAGIYHLDE